MKRIAMILSFSLLVSSLVMSETIDEWKYEGRTALHDTMGNYANGKSGAKADFSVDGEMVFPDGRGALKVVISAPSGQTNDSDIQLWWFTEKPLVEGNKYRISFWAKSSRSVKAKAVFALSEAPYSRYAEPGNKAFDIVSEWKIVSFEIECTKGTEGKKSRTPGLLLGTVPAGTTILFANIKIESL